MAKKKKKSLFARVYWSRVGLVVTTAATIVLILLYSEQRELNTALAADGWTRSFLRATARTQRAQRALDDRERDVAASERTASSVLTAANVRAQAVFEREVEANRRERDLLLRVQNLEVREWELERREQKATRREQTAAPRVFNSDHAFRLGCEAFERGDHEEAERHFREVLRGGPSQARRYRDEAGYHYWVRVLARGGAMSDVAKKILKRAELPEEPGPEGF